MDFCIKDISHVTIGGKLLSFSKRCLLYLWLPLEVYFEQASNDLFFFYGLTAFIIFHVVSNPFLKRELNLLDIFSMDSILLIVYYAVFLSSESANVSGSNITKNNFVLDDATIKILEIIIICTIIVFYIYFKIYSLLYLYRFLVKKFPKWFGVSNNFNYIIFI